MGNVSRIKSRWSKLDYFELLFESIDNLGDMCAFLIHHDDLFFQIFFLEFESMDTCLILCLEFCDPRLI